MAITPQDRDFLKQMFKNFRDEPLDPNDQQRFNRFYEPVFTELDAPDPVDQLYTNIDFEGLHSIQLLSGYRGSGKTTELLRLRRRLQDEGYFVLYANALEYLNPAEPIEIGELLAAIGGAFGEALDKALDDALSSMPESLWTRVWRLLQSDATLKEASVKAGIPGTGLDLKFELRSPTSFRPLIQQALARHLRTLKADADNFIEDGIKRILNARGPETRVVFIFDQLEQLRGSLQTQQTVIQSVQRIFEGYRDLLRFPYLHTVYSVPPWLKFVLQGSKETLLLSTVHLWNNDAGRTRCEPAWSVFRSFIRRRLDDPAQARLFGDSAEAMCDRLIESCGGHFRDLLRLLSDVVLRAASAPSLPIQPQLIEEVVSAARRDFLPIAQDDAYWLDQIARVRESALPDREPASIDRMTRFLDGHTVLYFRNADDWYDVHPLLREEVGKVVAAALAARAALA